MDSYHFYILLFCVIYKMEYENMRVAEPNALARERGLRGYSRLRKAELISLLRPPPRLVRFKPDRSRQQQLDERQPPPSRPSPQEMDIFEQQEMSKSRPQVMSKLNDLYDWLVNHVLKPIKDCTSRAFKTFKDKIMGLYGLLVLVIRPN